MDEQSKAARRRKLYESRREREFYAYYESLISLYKKEPRFCNLGDPDSVASHEATSSPDKALTAFVQLAALRLRARRSMLFFFDQSYAYVLAEATRSLSLQDDSRHTAGDSLWLGTSKIPRGFSICEVTADLPVNNGTNAHDAESKAIAHVINNLAEDTRFCDRPFVQDGPRARFYAGVPITTSKGINIGALCVLDDEPRGGLDSAELLFLTDMSTTVMAHLEMVSLMVRVATWLAVKLMDTSGACEDRKSAGS
jgi:GAF domain-containing protein